MSTSSGSNRARNYKSASRFASLILKFLARLLLELHLVDLSENKYKIYLFLHMIRKLNLFQNCLQCFKLLEKNMNNVLSCIAVGGFLLLNIAGSMDCNRI